MKYFTKPYVLFYVSLIWFMALMVHLPNHYGWGQIHYSTVLQYCTLDTELFSYLFFYASFLLLAIVLSFVYYTKIYLVLRKTTLARGMILGNQGQGKGEKDKNEKEHTTMSNLQNETKMIKATFKIFVLFFLCWAPLTVLFFLRFLCQVPLWAYLYAAMLAHGNSTLNFLIYFTSNENFVLALKKFANKVLKNVSNSDN
uniref:G-protein coupled receptors family 1 profile domain-containing protein n=1 Tax=Romanomermis culicivorax TaxID=13658 RepID=A0A915J9R4_ROMCU